MADYKFGIGEELRFNSPTVDLTHTWDFGDGTSVSSDPNPTHTYTSIGTYTITHTARDFCSACTTVVSHTVEISQASITVRSILLDKYNSAIGDIITITIVAQNLSQIYGTGSILVKFNSDTIGTYDVTLNPGQETTLNIQRQITSAGTINVCADNVCTMLSVESMISVESVTVDNAISTGQLTTATITARNRGTFTEDKVIDTMLSDEEGVTVNIDTRTVSIAPGGTYSYDVLVDTVNIPNGVYTICAENICKAISVAKPSEITGSLSVSSSPPGAEIFIDGESKGQFTPATVTNILSGSHILRLTLTGYNDTTTPPTEPIIITGGVTSYIYAILSPLEHTTGSINIVSSPSNAEITIDNVAQRDIDNNLVLTPATISDVPPGTHDVTIKKIGYVDYSEQINVTVGQTTYLGISMRAIPTVIGSANFTSAPEGAQIFVDDEPTGKLTNNTIVNLGAGDHTFRLELAGRNPTLGIVTIVGGATTYVSADLSLISSTIGGLNIVSYPAGAEILIGNTLLMVNTPVLIENLPPGASYDVTLKKEEYEDFRTTVDIIAGQTWYVGATLKKAVSITQAAQMGIPWWLIGGLAVGMFYSARKYTEIAADIRRIRELQESPRQLQLEGRKGKTVTLTKNQYRIA